MTIIELCDKAKAVIAAALEADGKPDSEQVRLALEVLRIYAGVMTL